MNSKFKGLLDAVKERAPETGDLETPEFEAPIAQAPELQAADSPASEPKVNRARPKTGSVGSGPVGAERRRRGRPPGKRSDSDFVQVTAYITRSTHRAAKIALLTEGKDRQFSELIETLLADWLRRQD